MDIQNMSISGMQWGAGLAVIPAAITGFIASSKIIFVNIIANIAMRILTANRVGLEIHGISFVQVPFLWKVSLVAAIVGGSIAAVSLVVYLANALFQKYKDVYS